MTAHKITLNVAKRDVFGSKGKKLRDQGLSLGNIVIPGKDSIAITAKASELKKVYEEAGESTLVYLRIDGEKTDRPTLFKETVFHPLRHFIFHVTLLQVDLNEEVEAAVPIEYVGEFKVNGGVLLKVKDSVEVRALPANLPENFIIDLSELKNIDDSITLADLKFDKSKIELVLSEDANAEDVSLVVVQEERVNEPEPEAEVVETEVTGATPAADKKAAAEAEADGKKE